MQTHFSPHSVATGFAATTRCCWGVANYGLEPNSPFVQVVSRPHLGAAGRRLRVESHGPLASTRQRGARRGPDRVGLLKIIGDMKLSY